jgi:hypothetical protein
MERVSLNGAGCCSTKGMLRRELGIAGTTHGLSIEESCGCIDGIDRREESGACGCIDGIDRREESGACGCSEGIDRRAVVGGGGAGGRRNGAKS